MAQMVVLEGRVAEHALNLMDLCDHPGAVVMSNGCC